MRSVRRGLRALALATVALVLTAEAAGALSSMSAVPSQVSAAAYVQEWGQILWGLVTSQTGTTPVITGDPVENADGSLTWTYAAPDGTRASLTLFPDTSARLEVILPDGTVQVTSQSPVSFDGVSVTTIQWSIISSNGLSVSLVSVQDDRGTMDLSDDTLELSGSAVLASGTTQAFTSWRAGGRTDLQSVQSDGSTFALSVPMSPPDFLLPDLTQTATGSYADPSFTVAFTLTPTPVSPGRWAAFRCDMGNGLTGTFSLNADFSGRGQVEQTALEGAELAALVAWTRDGDVEAYSLDGQNLHMGPSSAALDFLRHRWETLTAFLAPAPGASGLVAPPRRHVDRRSLQGTLPGRLLPPLGTAVRRSLGASSAPRPAGRVLPSR